MFWQLIRIEQTKLFKRAILWIELALLALGIAILHILLYATSQLGNAPAEAAVQIQQALTWPVGLMNGLSFAAGPNLGGLMMIILVGAVTAQEYTWRTLHLWLSQGVSRPALLGARFVALVVPALLVVLTALVSGGVITAVFSQVILGTIPFAEVAWGELLLNTTRITYTLLPYAALTFCLAVVSRSTVVAIGAGLAYALLLEGITVQLLSFAGGAWARVGQYLPVGLSRSLMESNAGLTIQVNGNTAPGATFVGPETAALGIAFYTLLFVGLALLVFRRQDLSG